MQPFCYEPLSNPKHLRLIWLEAGCLEDVIRLTVFESALPPQSEDEGISNQGDSVPASEYFALSYVWGDATTKLPIVVNGSRFEATKNLHEFLSHARNEMERKGPYWIDAVCINQTDDVEKGVQVNMMDKIYANTERCIVWLGLANDDTHLAFEVFQALEKMVEEILDAFTEEEAFITPEDSDDEEWEGLELKEPVWTAATKKESILSAFTTYRTLRTKIEGSIIWGESIDSPLPAPFSPEAWAAVIKLFQRPWFSRSWVVQEFILPRTIDIICGTLSMDALTLQIAHEVIFVSYSANGYPPGHGKIAMRAFNSCGEVCGGRLPQLQEETLLNAVFAHRRRGATDPRDKIFGHLSVGTASNHGIKADYTKSTRDVYHDFAVKHFDQVAYWLPLHKDLERAVPGLPSWVPDWSNPRPNRSWFQWIYRAGGGQFKRGEVRLSEDKLGIHLPGVFFDNIETCRSLKDITLKPDSIGCLRDVAANDPLFTAVFQPSYQSTEEILGRTLTCNSTISGNRAQKNVPAPLSPSIYELKSGDTYETHFIEERVLILTKGGWMGLAPVQCQKGDIVAVMRALSMPVALRPRKGGCYEMLGHCFCHGIMDGELMSVAENEASSRVIEEFEIR